MWGELGYLLAAALCHWTASRNCILGLTFLSSNSSFWCALTLGIPTKIQLDGKSMSAESTWFLSLARIPLEARSPVFPPWT